MATTVRVTTHSINIPYSHFSNTPYQTYDTENEEEVKEKRKSLLLDLFTETGIAKVIAQPPTHSNTIANIHTHIPVNTTTNTPAEFLYSILDLMHGRGIDGAYGLLTKHQHMY